MIDVSRYRKWNRAAIAVQQSVGLLSVFLLGTMPALAQMVSSDGTVGTVVTGNGPFTITGGSQSLTTLFHSFTDFSPGANSVLFQLDGSQSAVEAVVSRVTGNHASLINAQLSLTGGRNPDFFLINPNGITFGHNANLLLPGSFLASTAESVLFNGDVEFSATHPVSAPLLTIATPVGLQLGMTAGAINVEGAGHNLVKLGSNNQPEAFAPHGQLGPTVGLQVAPENTLALVGNGLELHGGVVTASGGNLALSSLAPGAQVAIHPTSLGFTLDHSHVEAYRNITLQQHSLLNTSGVPVQLNPLSPIQIFSTQSGQISVFGHQINLTEASLILNQNGFASPQHSGDILVKADQSLNILDSNPLTFVRSGIFSETTGNANGARVQVVAEDMVVQGGGSLASMTYGAGKSGQIDINANSRLELSGFNPEEPLLFSSIGGVSTATGTGGDVHISTQELLVSSGGTLTLSNGGSGTLGTIKVDADKIMIFGQIPPDIGGIGSNISSSNFGTGEVGTLILNTRLLTLQDGGTVSAVSRTSGPAGDIIINATEHISLLDSNAETNINRTAISSSVIFPSLLEQSLLGLAPIPSGNAGTVKITTPVLEMNGLSNIGVRNQGTGDAGSATIQADQVALRDGATIRARTREGAVGNIELDVAEFLLLRSGSSITVESPGTSNGGDINISVPVLIALEDSDIVADAIQGNGGNITITAHALLGTAFRPQQTPDSDITASSQFGLNGIVEINNFKGDVDTGVSELSADLEDPSNQITQGCGVGTHEFVMTGRGGVPKRPTDALSSPTVWIDFRENNALWPNNVPGERAPVDPLGGENVLTEAMAWQINATGQVELMAPQLDRTLLQDSIACLASSNNIETIVE